MIPAFAIARLPRIEFGAGSIRKLPAIAGQYGKRLLIVTGAASFTGSAAGERLFRDLHAAGFSWEIRRVSEEPSPQWVDATVAELQGERFDAVIGIGGGSPLDAAKAVAGLLQPGNSVMDHLEGVGPELPYQGPSTPFIAVPTTAGTGSEATKNAVLSVSGQFKKSFRDDKLVAEYAIVDPELLATCPPAQIAANGMDAFTQLMESCVSTRSNPLTDALAMSGMEAVRDGLLALYENPADSAAQARMAYASLLSGICLAQTGLGSVHGIVAPLGAFHPIGHGVGCGMLVMEATHLNIDLMEAREPDNPALEKYASIGKLFRGRKHVDPEGARVFLMYTLESWSRKLKLPRLLDFGVTEADIPRLVANSRGSSMKTNPVMLTDAEIGAVIRASL
ncbi:MAG: iron-containing alcohol dehydrogenase [Gammaproteobacteria bacterium]|nr:iron-containing alcohol dehydrogenase [Gammaproteobacteria bacterium]MBU1722684.1 iron-containing alcohol dehydrogenase [Gammaproteobacteria bacterium]MBU2006562.1 iron-containing alcohol dehydrogenase [Gammaproteobacteria bacterium]